jgi:hypothetical protein
MNISTGEKCVFKMKRCATISGIECVKCGKRLVFEYNDSTDRIESKCCGIEYEIKYED